MQEHTSNYATIAIEGIEQFGYHGVYPIEREKGTSFVVDVYLQTDIQQAGNTDDLDHTVDYAQVYKLVLSILQQPVNLLEKISNQAGTEILARFPQVRKCRLRVTKVKPIGMEHCQRTFVEQVYDRGEA